MPKKMNWSTVINDLLKAGYTQESIEAETDISQATISRLKNGIVTDPGWSIGNEILELWRSIK